MITSNGRWEQRGDSNEVGAREVGQQMYVDHVSSTQP